MIPENEDDAHKENGISDTTYSFEMSMTHNLWVIDPKKEHDVPAGGFFTPPLYLQRYFLQIENHFRLLLARIRL